MEFWEKEQSESGLNQSNHRATLSTARAKKLSERANRAHAEFLAVITVIFCARPCSPDKDENGKIKTPMNHEVFDGKHPWHLEKYPDIPNLHIIRHKPGERLGETLEFKVRVLSLLFAKNADFLV